MRTNISAPDGVFADVLEILVTAPSRDDYWVKARCFQNGELVYQQSVRPVDGVATVTLGPTRLWTDGAADGIAILGKYSKRGKYREVATTGFSVSAE